MEEVPRGPEARPVESPLPATDAVLHAVLYHAPLVLSITDSQGVFTVLEGAGLAAAGLVAGELVGQSAFTVFRDVPRIGQCLRHALDGKDISDSIEIAGALYAVHFSPVLDHQGAVIGAISVGRDITDQALAEEGLRASEERMHTVVEHAPVILMILDRNGIFTLYTGAGLQALGRKPGELVGQSLLEIYAGHPTIVDLFYQALAGHMGATTMEAGELQLEVQWAPTRDRQGEINGVMSVAVDVTARERALREAERAHEAAARLSQARSDFLAAVSHELRTPLTAVVGYAELLLSRWDRTDDGKRRDQVARIVTAATRQQRMVEDLLLLNQVENNALNLTPEPLELAPLVQRAVERMEADFPGQHISLHGPTLRVIGDRDRLPQVVANLLDNAAKSSPKGGTIAVTWEDDRDTVILRVRDQGPGIPEEWHEYIFTRFGRVPGSRNRAGRVGTGLGLYLSRQLARLMDGDLDLESSGPEGSVFRLRLPLAPVAEGQGQLAPA
ncbi:MAG TPA: PAS domain-containing sensor histidine kinase [Chloroflexota bacterium]